MLSTDANLTRQEVRAKITFGGFVIETPDVVSFSVQKTRGQSAAQFSASVKVSSLSLGAARESIDSTIVIQAGLRGNLHTIFTGKIYKCTFNPVRQDASKIMLNLDGKDVLGVLEGQKVTRRTRNYKNGDGPPERWGVVTGMVRHNTPVRKRLTAQPVDDGPVALPYEGGPAPLTLVRTKDNELYNNTINKDIPTASESLTIETVIE